MNIIKQDMLAITKGILFHQVNCQGVMGGGIALALAKKFPGLELSYQEFCQRVAGDADWRLNSHKLLGKVQLHQVGTDLHISNIFGQDNVSRTSRQTSYDATVEAFERIKHAMEKNVASPFSKLPLYFPYKMGCGLGGGNWNIYSAIIAEYFPEAVICQHNV